MVLLRKLRLGVFLVGLCAFGRAGVCAAADPLPSPSEASGGAARRRPLFFGSTLHLGGWYFDQVGPAAREIGGLRVGTNGLVAYAFSSGFFVGGNLGAAVYFPASGTIKNSNPHRHFSSTVAPGYELGAVAGWRAGAERPLAVVQLTAGVLYAGNALQWSGAGPFVAPSVMVFFVHGARIHVGLEAKGQYAPLPFGVPSNDQKVFYSGSVGLAALYD